MGRYIDADKLICHLKEEIGRCKPPFNSRANGKSIAYGTALGLKSAISFVETLSSADVVLRSELAVRSFKDAATIYNLQEINKNLVSEVGRLRNILLQFTDIVHKWGAKNNIDTSEISLVPILQEEADSIIKKANQELARKILMDIKALMQIIILDYKEVGSFENAEIVGYVQDHLLSELEKRYVEGEPIPASEEKHFSPEDVSKMTPQEVREKYTAICRSMEMW